MPHGFLRVDQYSVQRDLKVTRCAWVANWLALYLSGGSGPAHPHGNISWFSHGCEQMTWTAEPNSSTHRRAELIRQRLGKRCIVPA